MSTYQDGRTPRVTFEVWRVHEVGEPIRLYHGMDEAQGLSKWAECEADKADGYPEAAIEFHLVRAMTDRVRHSTGHAPPIPTTPRQRSSDD